MATLTLEDIPDDLVERPAAKARENQRSLAQEAVARLVESLATKPQDIEATIASLRRLHQKMAELPPLDDAFIQQAKNEGRL